MTITCMTGVSDYPTDRIIFVKIREIDEKWIIFYDNATWF